MNKLVHLVNPVLVGPESDLFQAQPVTFAAMEDARQWGSTHGVEARLCAVGYPEDAPATPPDFRRLPDLTRSVLDVGTFQKRRKLPLIGDLIQRAVDAADACGAGAIVYTNVDIAPMPDFYPAVSALLDRGYDAFTINRRTLARIWPNREADLPLMRAQVGEAHPGRDCFVFSREAARRYDLGSACIGAQYVGKVLAANMLYWASRYEDFAGLHLTFHLGADRSWLTPALGDYGEYNRRELAGALRRLQAKGGAPAHPAWREMVERFGSADPAE